MARKQTEPRRPGRQAMSHDQLQSVQELRRSSAATARPGKRRCEVSKRRAIAEQRG